MIDLLKPNGKRVNHKKGIAASNKALKRDAAKLRQAAYDKLTIDQKFAKLNLGGFEARKQRAKLMVREDERLKNERRS